jgi:para-aminobenzoate synthetase component 1
MGQALKSIPREEAIETINKHGASGKPLLFLISFDGDNNLVASPEEAAHLGFQMQMPAWGAPLRPTGAPIPIQITKYPVEPHCYKSAFDQVIGHIHYGNTFLLNLTFPTPIETNYSLQEIYTGSRARYKLLIEEQLVVFSPERFVHIRGNSITASPMKGTMDATVPGAFRKLASDPKEDAEHNTIVDLIRNDLSTVATNVRVSRFKYIEKVRTHQGELLQMSSEITGTLPEGHRESLGDILFSMLPAGSICGAPKAKTLEIIRQVEGYQRGFYTGIFGYVNGRELDSAVAIRYIEKQGNKLVFKSGGGITYQSDWRKEYEEMVSKVYVPVF